METTSATVTLLLALSYMTLCNAQCFMEEGPCLSEGVEHKDGDKWTTSDCFDCWCSKTGRTEVLLSCWEYSNTGKYYLLDYHGAVRKVRNKSNFAVTCDQTIQNEAWKAEMMPFFMKIIAPLWHQRFIEVDYVFEEVYMGCCGKMPSYTGVDSRCEVITNQEECSSKVVLAGTNDQCPYPYGAIL